MVVVGFDIVEAVVVALCLVGDKLIMESMKQDTKRKEMTRDRNREQMKASVDGPVTFRVQDSYLTYIYIVEGGLISS